MLSREAIDNALPLAEILDARRLTVQPREGTPLAALVNATRSDEHFMVQTDAGYTPDIVTIEYMANKKDELLQHSPHDIVMDDIREVCSKAVQEHMYFARNVAAPAVAALVEKTNQTLLEMTPSALLGMQVVIFNPPEPLLVSAFEASVRRFEETPFDVPPLAMQLPTITVKEIQDLMGTGTSSLDKAVAEWAASKGESFFINIWENVFQMKQAGLGDNRVVTFRDFTEDRVNGVENALAIYLLSRRLCDETLPGTEMDLKSYNALMVEYRNQSGARLCRALDELDLQRKTKTLVRSIEGTVTTVNGPVYAEWLDQGGCVEVLYGNLLEAPSRYTVDQINANAGKLKAAWERHSAIQATVEANRRHQRIKDILARHFIAMMRDITEGEEATVANRETVIKLFMEELEKVSSKDVDDLWGTCLRLVCRSRFYRTEAERILSGIERVKSQHPNIDVREAAAISVLEYIAYWVSTQFKVVAV